MTPPIYSRSRLLDRKVQQRDARLYVIATEDRYAAPQYFNEVLHEDGVVDRARVKVHVLPTEDNRSSPEAVLGRLRSFVAPLKPMDQRWLVLDVDHWASGSHLKGLARVCKEAADSDVGLALSNPSFEAWLLLHFTPEQPPETVDGCAEALRQHAGSYNKTRLKRQRYTRAGVIAACARAKALDTSPESRWPQRPGSHVYRVVESMLQE